jgi:hypothetical protein
MSHHALAPRGAARFSRPLLFVCRHQRRHLLQHGRPRHLLAYLSWQQGGRAGPAQGLHRPQRRHVHTGVRSGIRPRSGRPALLRPHTFFFSGNGRSKLLMSRYRSRRFFTFQVVSLVCQLLQGLEGTSIAKALEYYRLSLNFVCFGFRLSCWAILPD